MLGGQKPEQNRARDGRYCDHIDQVLRGHRYPRVFGAAVLFFISLAFGDLSFSLGYFTLSRTERAGNQSAREAGRSRLAFGCVWEREEPGRDDGFCDSESPYLLNTSRWRGRRMCSLRGP
jgi:hypothetical protein